MNVPDKRPQRFGWAPGTYSCRCWECGKEFSGDKRAMCCAPCAYNDAELVPLRAEVARLTKDRDEWKACAERVDAKMLAEQADHNKTVDKLIAANAEVARLTEVVGWAQATLTALNVGDVRSGSPLHLKLREVMIASRKEEQ